MQLTTPPPCYTIIIELIFYFTQEPSCPTPRPRLSAASAAPPSTTSTPSNTGFRASGPQIPPGRPRRPRRIRFQRAQRRNDHAARLHARRHRAVLQHQQPHRIHRNLARPLTCRPGAHRGRRRQPHAPLRVHRRVPMTNGPHPKIPRQRQLHLRRKT